MPRSWKSEELSGLNKMNSPSVYTTDSDFEGDSFASIFSSTLPVVDYQFGCLNCYISFGVSRLFAL